jgi:hypothetical protein
MALQHGQSDIAIGSIITIRLMHRNRSDALIHRITILSMQGPDPQEFYSRKATDHALAQNIKDTYGDVEKGTHEATR